MADLNQLMGRGVSVVKDAAGAANRLARFSRDVAEGAVQRATGRGAKSDMDDATLHRKVESIVFRPADAPKSSVDVNVVDGVVYLHGEARTPEEINRLEDEILAIPEVQGVENLLHLPNTPAPTRADAPPSQRKSRRTAPRSENPRARRRSEPVSEELPTPAAEPGPAEKAARGEGRGPAPMGSTGDEAEERPGP